MTSSRWTKDVAIVGVGITNIVRRADNPVASLAVEASNAAIEDAGLRRADIEGVVCGTQMPAYSTERLLRPGYDYVDSKFLARHMNIEPVWHLDTEAFPAALAYATQAVASGAANYVLVNRTLHNPAGRYNSFSDTLARGATQWTAPYGYVAPTSAVAMTYMEYQQRFGAKREHMATMAVQFRQNVQQQPSAYWYGRDLTFDDYMNSRVISDPMCLFDNDIPVDGSGSFIVTSADRARDLPHKPVYLIDWAQVRNPVPLQPGTFGPLDVFYEHGKDLASRLWSRCGLAPNDIDVVQLYDGFTPIVWMWLESLGFCGLGEAWQFIQGGRIAPNGPFPLNSGGGNQGWGRMHGFTHALECYLQLAGRAGARQQARASTAISSYGTPGHGSGSATLYSNLGA